MKRFVAWTLLAATLVLSPILAVATTVPPAQLSDIPLDAEMEYSICVEGTDVIVGNYTLEGTSYRFVFAPSTHAWLLVAFETERVWLGIVTDTGVLTVMHALTLEEAKTQYPNPCVWLERNAV